MSSANRFIVKYKMECENYKEENEKLWNENQDLKLKQTKHNEELTKKM